MCIVSLNTLVIISYFYPEIQLGTWKLWSLNITHLKIMDNWYKYNNIVWNKLIAYLQIAKQYIYVAYHYFMKPQQKLISRGQSIELLCLKKNHVLTPYYDKTGYSGEGTKGSIPPTELLTVSPCGG